MKRPAPLSLAGFLLVGLMHLAVLYVMMQRQSVPAVRSQPPPLNADRHKPIQWLLPPRPAVRPQAISPLATTKQDSPAAPRIDVAAVDKRPGLPRPLSRQPSAATDALVQAPRPQPAPVKTAPATAPATAAATAHLPDDPFAPPMPARSSHDIVAQARQDVGKIDKELRKIHPERTPALLADSKQAILEKGMNAAYEARPVKWYEAARITELTTPDGENKTRTYKVVTALLTYCISITHTGTRSYTTCP